MIKSFSNKKYQIILCDPPWEYKKSGGIKSARGLAKKYYPTMKLEDIKSLPINGISDINCYLFLWVTAPCMQEGLEVLRVWGFNFFTIAFTWIKTNKNGSLFWGMGNSTRANPEYVLLGRRGKLKRISASIHSVLLSPIGRHSEKPHEIRDRIVELYDDLPRIELFARKSKNTLFENESYEGWDLMGYDIDGYDIRESLNKLIK